MRRAVCAVVAVSSCLLSGSSAWACSYADVHQWRVVAPGDGAQDVPLNAKVVLRDYYRGSSDAGVRLERIESDGGSTPLVTVEETLQWRASGLVTIRIAPQGGFAPGADYVVRAPYGQVDGGWVSTPVTLSAFRTGAAADTSAPAAPNGVAFVTGKLLPDAGGDCGQRGGPVFEVDAQLPNVADAGEEVLYFARSGDAGVFSAVEAPGLSGYAACLATPPEGSFNLNVGPAQVEVWTEDLAGNASPSVTVSTNIDCTSALAASDGGSGPVDAGPTDGRELSDGGPFGCSAAGSGGLAGVVLSLLLLPRRKSRAARPVRPRASRCSED